MTLIPTRDEFDGTVENARKHLMTLHEMYLIARAEGPDVDPIIWEEFNEAYEALVQRVKKGEVLEPEEIIALYEMLVEHTL